MTAVRISKKLKYKDIKNIKLDPICFKEFAFSITNKGELLPCCYCDEQDTLDDPEFQKLVKVSKLKDYDKIEDIFKNKEWKEFYDLLVKNIPPCHACFQTCGYKLDGTPIKRVREDMSFDSKGNVEEHTGSPYSQHDRYNDGWKNDIRKIYK